MSTIETLIRRNRTCRRFDEQHTLDPLQLQRWINIIRQTASSRNVQPLKYLIVTDKAQCDKLTSLMHWAAMLPEWEGPREGERPTAYLIQLVDTHIAAAARFDEGIQLQALGLLATEAEYGICIFSPHSRGDIARMYDLPQHLSINAVVALGKPAEEPILEELRPGEEPRYWRDSQGRHHVPKRGLDELIIKPNQASIF